MPQNGINHAGVAALAKSFEFNKNLKVRFRNSNGLWDQILILKITDAFMLQAYDASPCKHVF